MGKTATLTGHAPLALQPDNPATLNLNAAARGRPKGINSSGLGPDSLCNTLDDSISAQTVNETRGQCQT